MNKSSKPKQAKTTPPKTHSPKSEVPKTTTTKTGKGESYHKGKQGHGGHSSHTEFGVGMDVDLSGIGQRRPEPDPFAIGGGGPPVAHTQEKPERPKNKEKQITKPDPFSNVSLTGPQAKGESEPPGPINVADNEVQTTDSLPLKTDEKSKEKKKKPKPTWPKNIRDWLDLKDAWGVAQGKYSTLSEAHRQALYAFWDKSQHLKDLKQEANTACGKAKSPNATQADKEACEKALMEVKKQKDALTQDFDNTPEGKQLLNDKNAALKALKQAREAAENAAKDIDKATQDKVEKTMKKWAASQWRE